MTIMPDRKNKRTLPPLSSKELSELDRWHDLAFISLEEKNEGEDKKREVAFLKEERFRSFPIKQAVYLAAALIENNSTGTKPALVVRDKGVYRISHWAGKVKEVINAIDDGVDWDGLQKQQINPLAELFFSVFLDADFREKLSRINVCKDLVCGKHVDADELVRDLNSRFDELTKKLVEASQGPEFKKQLNSYRRVYNKNRQSLLDYIHQLFESHSRLLVIRLDLSYKTEAMMERLDVTDVGHDEVTVDDVISHREQFIDYLRENFGKALRGYVWKLEHGSLKGYHYHTIIFLDGSMYRKDETIAQILGEQWMETITGNRGLYFNCNAHKEIRYKSCAVGMRSHSDPDLWDGMHRLIEYLTKPDFWIRLQLPGNRRTFGKGGGLPKTTQPKRGRPREKLSTVSPRQTAKEASEAR